MGSPEPSTRVFRLLALLVLALLAGAAYYFELPAPLAAIATQATAHLAAATAVPNWALYLLALAALPSLVRLVRGAFGRRPGFLGYTEDRFLGLTWRWRYRRFGQPGLPWAYCPQCDTALVYNSEGDSSSMRTVLTCETCDRKILQHEGDAQYLAAKILRQIERKLRTGEWRDALAARRDGPALDAAQLHADTPSGSR